MIAACRIHLHTGTPFFPIKKHTRLTRKPFLDLLFAVLHGTFPVSPAPGGGTSEGVHVKMTGYDWPPDDSKI